MNAIKEKRDIDILDKMETNGGFERISYRKIGIILGIKHPQSVIYHLKRLEALGFIMADWNRKIFKKIKDHEGVSVRIVSIPIYRFGKPENTK